MDSSPVQARKHLELLRGQVSSSLIFVTDCIRCLEFTLSAASNTRTGAFYAILDPISLHAEDV